MNSFCVDRKETCYTHSMMPRMRRSVKLNSDMHQKEISMKNRRVRKKLEEDLNLITDLMGNLDITTKSVVKTKDDIGHDGMKYQEMVGNEISPI